MDEQKALEFVSPIISEMLDRINSHIILLNKKCDSLQSEIHKIKTHGESA